MSHHAKVVNIRTCSTPYVYIDRKKGERFHFGNPFTHLPNVPNTFFVLTREIAIVGYGAWLRGQDFWDVEPERKQWILDNLHALEGKDLGCYCAPLRCHGEVLLQLLKEKNA